MAWRIEFEDGALKDLGQLDPPIARRLLAFLRDRVASRGDPRSLGEALRGSKLGEFWKYRVGDWRIICRIEDEQVTVLVVRVGNRREIYKQA